MLLFSLFSIFAGATWALLYHQGKLGWEGEKEARRKDRVEKYGGIIIICMLILYLTGAWMLFDTVAFMLK